MTDATKTDKPKKQLSAKERTKRISELTAKLQQLQASQDAADRKTRDGQLIAFGVGVEEAYKKSNAAGRQKLVEWVKRYLKDSTLKRASAGFERLEAKFPPEPSSLGQ